MNLTANDLLDFFRYSAATKVLANANNSEIQELLKALHRWHGLASREADHRIRTAQEKSNV